MNYDMQKFLDGATAATFTDLMEFSNELAGSLVGAGQESIEKHVLATAISEVAQTLLDEEDEKKAKAAESKVKEVYIK